MDRAAKALVVLAACTLATGLVAVANRDDRTADLRAEDATLTTAEVSRAVDLGVTLAVVLSVLAALCYVVCARQVRSARRWARLLATVVAAIMTVLAASQLVTGSSGGLGLLLDVLAVVLGVAVLGWLWAGSTNRFFALSGR